MLLLQDLLLEFGGLNIEFGVECGVVPLLLPSLTSVDSSVDSGLDKLGSLRKLGELLPPSRGTVISATDSGSS